MYVLNQHFQKARFTAGPVLAMHAPSSSHRSHCNTNGRNYNSTAGWVGPMGHTVWHENLTVILWFVYIIEIEKVKFYDYPSNLVSLQYNSKS